MTARFISLRNVSLTILLCAIALPAIQAYDIDDLKRDIDAKTSEFAQNAWDLDQLARLLQNWLGEQSELWHEDGGRDFAVVVYDYYSSSSWNGPGDLDAKASGIMETNINLPTSVDGCRRVDAMVFWMPSLSRYYRNTLRTAAYSVGGAIESCGDQIPDDASNADAQKILKDCIEEEVSLVAILVVDDDSVGFSNSPGGMNDLGLSHGSQVWRLFAVPDL